MLRFHKWVTVLLMLTKLAEGIGYTQTGTPEDSFIVTGMIWDAETFQPIPYAHIYTSKQGTFSNIEGEYRLQVFRNDTLTVSHLGYEPQQAVISGRSESQFFWLTPLITTLSEVVVSPFPLEQAMKGIILQTRTVQPPLLVRGSRNLKIIQNMYLGGYKPEMNSMDNYLNKMRGPQDVSIFSTNPNRGLGAVLRNIKRK